jgi:hypothetical protein
MVYLLQDGRSGYLHKCKEKQRTLEHHDNRYQDLLGKNNAYTTKARKARNQVC